VIFPRTWEKVYENVEIDRIVLVEGRIDAQGAEPKILVDNITTEFDRIVSADALQTPRTAYTPAAPPQRQQPPPAQIAPAQTQPVAREPGAEYHLQGSPVDEFASSEPDFSNDLDWDNMPPLPEPPPDWDEYLASSLFDNQQDDPVEASNAGSGEEPQKDYRATDPPRATYDAVQEPRPALAKPRDERSGTSPQDDVSTPVAHSSPAVPQATAAQRAETPHTPPVVPAMPRKPAEGRPGDRLANLPPYLVSPTPADGEEGSVRMLTVILRSTGDKTRDVLRIRRIHGIITSYPGRDRFAIHVFERGRGYLLEFPNFTTGVSPELLERMVSLLGVENVRVEPITFQ